MILVAAPSTRTTAIFVGGASGKRYDACIKTSFEKIIWQDAFLFDFVIFSLDDEI